MPYDPSFFFFLKKGGKNPRAGFLPVARGAAVTSRHQEINVPAQPSWVQLQSVVM